MCWSSKNICGIVLFPLAFFIISSIAPSTFAINYEIFQSLDESARTDSLLFKFGKSDKQNANLNIIYQPMNNNNAVISYLKELGSLDLKISSNYNLFSNIPDYGANIELSGTF